MGKPAGRLGDTGSGHGKCSPTPITSGSGDVTINGQPAARKGDSLAPHCKHGRSIAEGSSSVFINGKPAARVGDAIGCGGVVITGSGNVTIGDKPELMKPSDASLPDIEFNHRRRSVSGGSSSPSTSPITQPRLDASDRVEIEEQAQVPEFKDVVIRLDILPEQAANDMFTLEATDGSYHNVKTAKDDLIPGDCYIDLLFEKLDTSKRYRLTHHYPDTGDDYIYFDNLPYGSV
jgi:uncharacterized Zn-binding protein involved in type VI secretion